MVKKCTSTRVSHLPQGWGREIEGMICMKLKCDLCGIKFKPGNRPDGIPNGVSFVLNTGKTVTYCADCIMKIGQGKAEEIKKKGGLDDC